jgi:hypothetical protein
MASNLLLPRTLDETAGMAYNGSTMILPYLRRSLCWAFLQRKNHEVKVWNEF